MPLVALKIRWVPPGKLDFAHDLPDYVAECLTCGWRCTAANAQGVGAQHARKQGHCVRVQVEVARIYNHES